MKRWGRQFFSSTRGQVVSLLRRGEATVGDLADRLDLTNNAIRAHLATLERDGLVRQAGKRPGVRKPETLYVLTREAEQLFPKAYNLILNGLLDALDDRLPEGEVEELLEDVGSRLAQSSRQTPVATLEERVERGLATIEELGGLAELDDGVDHVVIRGLSCPVRSVAVEHPEVCGLAEALLSAVMGVRVEERCERGGIPRCVFHVVTASG